MKKTIACFTLALLTFFVAAQSPNSNMKIVIIPYIHDGNLTYAYSLKGVENHLEALSIQKDMQDTYQALKPIVDKMKAKKRNAVIVSAILGSAGAGVAGYGGYLVATEPDFNGNKVNQNKGKGFLLLGGGVFAGFIGIMAPQIVNGHNSEDDLMKYVNHYNILHPEKPLEVY